MSPLETRAPNATGQSPAFAGQTRACGLVSNVAHQVTVVATGLAKPWSVEPMADGSFLVTEKAGRLRHVSASGAIGAPINGLPAVDARGQGGLLDVALSPQFGTDRMIYWSFAEPRGNGTNATSVARGVLAQDRASVTNVQVVFQSQPAYAGTMHYGSRLAFGPDGMLYITLGERSDTITRPQAQHMNSHLGKIIRIHPDGRVPTDNPFVGQQGARPEIWTVGHRNVQAATFDNQGRFWEIEHGARGGDELNQPQGLVVPIPQHLLLGIDALHQQAMPVVPVTCALALAIDMRQQVAVGIVFKTFLRTIRVDDFDDAAHRVVAIAGGVPHRVDLFGQAVAGGDGHNEVLGRQTTEEELCAARSCPSTRPLGPTWRV